MSRFGRSAKTATKTDDIPLAPPAEVTPTYGVGDVVKLLRSVPIDRDLQLVLAVIKATLQSLNVNLADIIEDASRHLAKLEARTALLTGQIDDYEAEVRTRLEEISRLEADYVETTSVKDRLQGVVAAPPPARRPAPQMPDPQ